MLQLEAIRVLSDNYVWSLHDGRAAVLVDPGEAAPILTWLAMRRLSLAAVFITHHHADHCGGLPGLRAAWPGAWPVYGPEHPTLAGQVQSVHESEMITVDALGSTWQVLHTPGHTLSHLCYFGAGYLFSGDTLFSCGCGRLFEGTAAQMWHSLQRLAALPATTQICCAHEYTLNNLAFAREIEPEHPSLAAWEREAQQWLRTRHPTLPVTLEAEIQRNPFLRCAEPALQRRLARVSQAACIGDATATFAALRQLKDQF